MSRLGLAQLEIFAFHRLLGAHQLLLQRSHRLHAAAERDHLARAVELNRRIKHRQVRAGGRPMIHHAPARHSFGR